MKDQNILKEAEHKGEKKSFEEPKLTFIEPKLTKYGDATKITTQNGFFGAFSPNGVD